MAKKTKIVKRAKSEVPTGVKIIAILQYICAGFLVLFGLLFLVGSNYLAGVLSKVAPFLATLGATFFIVIAIICLAFAALAFFVGRGLWKAQNWARILVIIFSALGVLSGLVSIIKGDFGSIVSLAINGLIGWYLYFNADVKKAFA